MVCIGILIILFSLVLIRRRYSQNNIRLSAYHCILTLSGILIAFGLWFGWIVLAAYCPLTVYVMEKDAITKVRKYMKIHPKRTRLLAAVMAIALVIDIPMGINKIILNGKKQEYTELLEQKITEAYSDEVCVQYGLQSISCKVTPQQNVPYPQQVAVPTPRMPYPQPGMPMQRTPYPQPEAPAQQRVSYPQQAAVPAPQQARQTPAPRQSLIAPDNEEVLYNEYGEPVMVRRRVRKTSGSPDGELLYDGSGNPVIRRNQGLWEPLEQRHEIVVKVETSPGVTVSQPAGQTGSDRGEADQ